MSKLHELKLGEIAHLQYAEVMRVPGGWIFVLAQSSNFVPYSDEFKDEE